MCGENRKEKKAMKKSVKYRDLACGDSARGERGQRGGLWGGCPPAVAVVGGEKLR